MKNFAFSIGLAVVLVACYSETEFNPQDFVSHDEIGEDVDASSSSKMSSSSRGTSSAYDDMIIVSSYNELLACSAKQDGLEAYVEDEGAIYVCDDGDWMIRWRDEYSSSSSSSALYMDTQRMLDSILASFSSSSVLIMPGLSSSSVFMPGLSSSSVMIPSISSSSSTPIIIEPTRSHYGVMSWEGYAGEYSVVTDLDNGTETAGYWYTFGDSIDGGKSRIEWPTELGNEYDNLAMDPVIDVCGGVCGKFILDAGSLAYKPFVGVAFNIAGMVGAYKEDNLDDADLADASAWGGICIVYSSDLPATLELGFGAYKDKAITYDYPFVTLPKSVIPSERCFEWSAFKQAGWGRGDKITGEEAGAELASIKFKIQAQDGSSGNFNISAIGSYY